METQRVQTAFRLRDDLLERLIFLARRQNRSLNNYVESVLMEAVYREPNQATKSAIAEARNPKSLESLDVDTFEEFVKRV